MTREQWRKLDRELRIAAREYRAAKTDLLLFGTSAVEIGPGGPRRIDPRLIR